MSKETLKVQIDRFKTADVEREVLKLATMASNITFVQQLIEKVDELEKKLDIAVKALEDYADEENWSTATTEINTDYFKFEYSMYGLEHNGFEDAQKALKEMEEV